MKIPIPASFDRVMDFIAMIVFPSRRWITVTLIAYTLIIGIGLSLWLGSWLWFPGTVLCMLLAWMINEWV